MEEPRVYNLYLQPGMKAVLVIVLVVLIGMGAAFIIPALALPHSPKGPPMPIGIIWLVIGVLYLGWILTLPRQITLSDDGVIEFISTLRRRRVRAQEIKSIKPQGSQFGFFIIRTDQGKIKILAQFDGFHDFLTRLEALHPGVELRGC